MIIDRTEWLSIDQNSYQKNRIAIDIKEQLLIDRMAIDRTECLSIEKNGYNQNRTAMNTETQIKQIGYCLSICHDI